jgi:hypothetical protein
MLMLRVAADVGERQDDDREVWRPSSSRLKGGERGWRDFRASIKRIDPHRSHDVLEVLVSEIDEVRVDLAAHVVVGCARDQHAARLAKALQPRRDVHAVA